MITEVDHAIRGEDSAREQHQVRWRATGGITADGGSLFESMVR